VSGAEDILSFIKEYTSKPVKQKNTQLRMVNIVVICDDICKPATALDMSVKMAA
jgi:hypothetical protein